MRRFARGVALVVLASALSGACACAAETVRAVDVARSHAGFAVAHLYLTKVSGTIAIAGGTVVFADGSPVPIRITATLDPRHVDTGNGDRDDDLQGPDWFDTRRFPLWTFASTALAPGANGSFLVNGTLTVQGVAQPVALSVTQTRATPTPAYRAVGHADRHGFGMRTTPMDGLIGAEIEITLDVVLAQ
jgi:polyisoprenoid-binding protein YceI